MRITTDLTDPVHWLIATLLIVSLALQSRLLFRHTALSARRRWIRAGLNLVLWLVTAAFFLQPAWPTTRPATHALLVGDEVPGAVARRLQDSLRIDDSVSPRTLRADYDSITLVGQEIPIETLTRLSNTTLRWIPYKQPDRLESVHWQAIVREGDVQRVTGRIWSSGRQPLTIRYGNQTLDSVVLHPGDNPFALRFPAFTRGRTQTELVLNRATLDTVRFYSRAPEPLTVQFLLNHPDFESRTLADWLGKHGHTVNLSTTLSRNISSSLNINKPAGSPAKTPDLLITEPVNAGHPTVRKAVAAGRAVLFINLTDAEADCQAINRALGSRWRVRKTTNEPVVTLADGLNALPYRFVDALNQFPVAGYPVAVQRTRGRVGVSLFSETFPLALSGDSLTYRRIWTAVLAELYPTSRNNLRADAPLYAGLRQTLSINHPATPISRLPIGRDTLSFVYSPINPQSATGYFQPNEPGWQPVADTLAMYIDVTRADDPVANRAIISRYLMVHATDLAVSRPERRHSTTELPGWAWLVLFIVALSAVWVEPKIR